MVGHLEFLYIYVNKEIVLGKSGGGGHLQPFWVQHEVLGRQSD